jgi:hypothetical protein
MKYISFIVFVVIVDTNETTLQHFKPYIDKQLIQASNYTVDRIIYLAWTGSV